MYTVLSLEAIDQGIYFCDLAFGEQQLQAMVIGTVTVNDVIDGDWSLDEIMALRPASADQIDGFGEGPGFSVFCGTITKAYAWGSYDLSGGGITLMLDADELPKCEISLGMRLSLGFKHPVLTMTSDD